MKPPAADQSTGGRYKTIPLCLAHIRGGGVFGQNGMDSLSALEIYDSPDFARWYAQSGTRARTLSLERATKIAKKQRDTLAKRTEELESAKAKQAILLGDFEASKTAFSKLHGVSEKEVFEVFCHSNSPNSVYYNISRELYLRYQVSKQKAATQPWALHTEIDLVDFCSSSDLVKQRSKQRDGNTRRLFEFLPINADFLRKLEEFGTVKLFVAFYQHQLEETKRASDNLNSALRLAHVYLGAKHKRARPSANPRKRARELSDVLADCAELAEARMWRVLCAAVQRGADMAAFNTAVRVAAILPLEDHCVKLRLEPNVSLSVDFEELQKRYAREFSQVSKLLIHFYSGAAEKEDEMLCLAEPAPEIAGCISKRLRKRRADDPPGVCPLLYEFTLSGGDKFVYSDGCLWQLPSLVRFILQNAAFIRACRFRLPFLPSALFPVDPLPPPFIDAWDERDCDFFVEL